MPDAPFSRAAWILRRTCGQAAGISITCAAAAPGEAAPDRVSRGHEA